MKVAAVQHDVVWEDRVANHAHLADLIAGAAAEGANLVVLTEMFPVGFSMAAERIAEPPDGPSIGFLVQQAEEHGLWAAGSVPVRDEPELMPVNRFVLAGPDGTLHHYDKMYPFTYAGERDHYRPGDRPVTVTIEGVRVSLFVCYDLRFSEAFWDVAETTDLYLVPANWPSSRREHWMTLLRARAIENQAYVVGVNRVGEDPRFSYSGDSLIVDPLGEVLADAEPGEEAVLLADVDPSRVAEVRAEFPFLQDRRGR